MPILGGNSVHEWASSDSVESLDSTHKTYKINDDVAGQLKADQEVETYRDYCPLTETYYQEKLYPNSFKTKFKKVWDFLAN